MNKCRACGRILPYEESVGTTCRAVAVKTVSDKPSLGKTEAEQAMFKLGYLAATSDACSRTSFLGADH